LNLSRRNSDSVILFKPRKFLFDMILQTLKTPASMKNLTFKSTIVITVLSAASITVAQANGAQPVVNPYEALTGRVSLSPGGIVNTIRWANFSIATTINGQQTGSEVTPLPSSPGQTLFVSGTRARASRFTNRQVLEAMVERGDLTTINGFSLRYAKIGNQDYLQAVNRRLGESSAVLVPDTILTFSTGWADFKGVYQGSATLTATPTASSTSGTYVYVSSGSLRGLTEYSGMIPSVSGDPIFFSGVGNFANRSDNGVSGSASVTGVTLPPN
jgi:hypothetical protein